MNIDMNHKYQTRDGRAVRILCVDGPDSRWPVVGFIEDCRATLCWDIGGYACKEGTPQEYDLVPVPTKHEGWVLLSLGEKKEPLSVLFDSLEEAEEMSYSKSVGMKRPIVAHVTWED
jgi:hypothetical protein